MQVNGAFHGIEKTRVIKAYNISVSGIDFSSDEANKAMIKKNPQTLDQRPGPTQPEDSGGRFRPDPARGSGRVRSGSGSGRESSSFSDWYVYTIHS